MAEKTEEQLKAEGADAAKVQEAKDAEAKAKATAAEKADKAAKAEAKIERNRLTEPEVIQPVAPTVGDFFRNRRKNSE